jgi:8-oxo-dGTP pyrophosphatase MutT (NUDIX family)
MLIVSLGDGWPRGNGWVDDGNIERSSPAASFVGVMSLELPGGAVEQSDSSPLIAAERELEKETGLFTSDWLHLAQLSPNPASH